MVDITKLENAVYQTYMAVTDISSRKIEEKGINQIKAAIEHYMRNGDTKYFSNYNGERNELVENVSRDDAAEYFAEVLLNNANRKKSENKMEQRVYSKLYFASFDESPEEQIEKIKKCLLGKTPSYNGMDKDTILKVVSEQYTRDVIQKRELARFKLNRNIQENVNPQYGIKNLNVNMPVVNYCREEVLSGKQIQIQNDIAHSGLGQRPRREYNLNDEMYVVTDIGQKRDDQQDSVVVLYHPDNPKYKMLVVADGMGGSVDGNKASQLIVQRMTKWFEGIPKEYMYSNNEEQLKQQWSKELNEINTEINSTFPRSGSTFVGAIVGDKNTTIASVGDSRAYVVGKNRNIYQMTSDDNIEYKYWQQQWKEFVKSKGGEPLTQDEVEEMQKQKDNLRFMRSSNVITGCLGMNYSDELNVHFSGIPNDKYETLMLFSDGVTDCLSDSQLYAITRNTDPKYLARVIVNNALTNESYRPDLRDNADYRSHISAGKDNTTAAVYRNDGGEER